MEYRPANKEKKDFFDFIDTRHETRSEEETIKIAKKAESFGYRRPHGSCAIRHILPMFTIHGMRKIKFSSVLGEYSDLELKRSQ